MLLYHSGITKSLFAAVHGATSCELLRAGGHIGESANSYTLESLFLSNFAISVVLMVAATVAVNRGEV